MRWNNLPPGVTDQMIEDHFDRGAKHYEFMHDTLATAVKRALAAIERREPDANCEIDFEHLHNDSWQLRISFVDDYRACERVLEHYTEGEP